MIAFGPVPSRRLGRSLGVNNIPPKFCTYSCVYCQLGRTPNMQVKRERFHGFEEVVKSVKEKVTQAEEKGELIDYMTFIPDGEPTLDIDLGREIDLIRELGIKIAVISNASLIWKEHVRDELSRADWVSVKVDAVREDVWRRINRPHGSLSLEEILQGIRDFSQSFGGELTTETMLVEDLNDSVEELNGMAEFIAEVKPVVSYLSIPTRPPAETWVKAASEGGINAAYQILSSKGVETECIIGYEGTAFASTGNVEEDLLSITSVHPMREDAVREFLAKANAEWELVENLIEGDRLVAVDYEGRKFYVRKLGTDRGKSRTIR
ncbi:MAG: radical SAM protein [Thermoplasmata archaeon]|nr:radical SAM protein [Thermoplasmata archaeon]